MSHDDKNIDATIDDREIDLLVDGELGDERRRKLLAELDTRPGGWRRCALAFLENQCWRQSCASFAEDTMSRPSTPSASTEQKVQPAAKKSGKISRQRPSSVAKAAGALLTMSACFLFGAGLMSLMWNANQQGHPGRPDGGISQAAVIGATPIDPEDSAIVHDQKNVILPGEFKTVRVTAQNSDGKKSSFQIPAVKRDKLDLVQMRNMPSAIPSELVQSFRDAGHDVRQTRRLVPFQMKENSLVIPVDQLEVRYVDTPYYQ